MRSAPAGTPGRPSPPWPRQQGCRWLPWSWPSRRKPICSRPPSTSPLRATTSPSPSSNARGRHRPEQRSTPPASSTRSPPSLCRPPSGLTRSVLTALEGARGDDRLVPLAEQLRAQRAVTAAWIVDGLTAKTSLRAGLDRSEAIDIVWLLMDPAVYERLTTARHWRPDRFGRFFADGVVRLLTEARPA